MLFVLSFNGNHKAGNVLYSKIVPDDGAEHILEAMRTILLARSADAPVITVIYTDNVVRDKPGILALFEELGLPVCLYIKMFAYPFIRSHMFVKMSFMHTCELFVNSLQKAQCIIKLLRY